MLRIETLRMRIRRELLVRRALRDVRGDNTAKSCKAAVQFGRNAFLAKGAAWGRG